MTDPQKKTQFDISRSNDRRAYRIPIECYVITALIGVVFFFGMMALLTLM